MASTYHVGSGKGEARLLVVLVVYFCSEPASSGMIALFDDQTSGIGFRGKAHPVVELLGRVKRQIHDLLLQVNTRPIVFKISH